MYKILMVCMGNICRSPMAQGIMEQKIKQYGLNASIDSAGTLAYHTGEPPDERAIETAAYHGINISGQVARQITPADLNLFDLILVMDRENYESVMRLAVPQKAAQRIHYVTYLAFPGQDVEVPDPYYGGNKGFEKVFSLLEQSCDAIALELKEKRLA